ncbi:MAG: phenylalanine--tRNA ligase subunit alpha, partial [Myxococcales bacterium]|nr:phenylalanine--tRNA ligase subunit alpha [Myxococcales bacterium]
MADATAQFEAGLSGLEGELGALASWTPATESEVRERAAKLIGPSGELTQLLKLMRDVAGDKRRELGSKANALKESLRARFDEHLEQIAKRAREAELSGAFIDVSLPGRRPVPGRPHPIRQVLDELIDIFTALGFDVADGPEVELYDYNFTKLGFPPDHPATDMQDSFFISPGNAPDKEKTLLRTHTSGIQVREMLRRKPPLAVIAPGAVYRRDDDITHSPMFFQLEGLLVDEDVSFGDLKGVLTLFVQRLFGEQVPTRFRPSYFPFVEPGGEMDVGCVFCKPWEGDAARTAACRVCKGTGWLEILGC